ncbi:MAG: DNA-directed DNA polymerase I [Nitrososphaerota archaeon]
MVQDSHITQQTSLEYWVNCGEKTLYLLSSAYDGQSGKAYLKMLDPEKNEVVIIYDESGHKPYCYSNLSLEELSNNQELKARGAIGFVEEKKYDLLHDKEVTLVKIIANDPLAIGGKSNSIREFITAWEADIPYHLCYLYDKGLIPGMPYKVVNGELIMMTASNENVNQIMVMAKHLAEVKGEDAEEVRRWLSILEAQYPKIKHVSIDIEVLAPVTTRVPSPTKAEDPVVAISFVGSDGFKAVFLLRRGNVVANPISEGFELKLFDDEKTMLEEAFNIINSYPLVATFNGDDFDLPYLKNRGDKLGVPKEKNPIIIGREGATLRKGIHVDLYRLFLNKSIQVYAFDNKYRENTLEAISTALVGKGKVEISKPMGELSLEELARYSFWDAMLVHELLTFNNSLLIKLLIILARIGRMPIEYVCRHGVSGWIKSLLYFEHRRRGYLIPRQDELLQEKGATTTKAVIEGKKYRGALVAEPMAGVHFGVTVLDFASLYPSALKEWNLSYETVRCVHEECKDNIIPETGHWVCKKRRGLQSLVIGALRDIRIGWYKPKSGDKTLQPEVRSWYEVVQRALKVLLNASYGVFGFSNFQLYCPPVAESTAAIGRYAFKMTLKKAKELGIQVVYGDTDSLFLKTNDPKLIDELISWAKSTLRLDLEVDKVYRYVVFSTRKKNYLGVTTKDVVDVKGLTGKKRHIPTFIKEAFDNMLEEFKKVQSEEDFEQAKQNLQNLLRTWYYRLKNGQFELEDLAFRVMLSKMPERYTKTTPQHVKAAKKLEAVGIQLSAGDIISFVKTKDKDGVRPLQLAKPEHIDVDKYIDYMRSTFEQVLDALGIDFDKMVGVSSLESFM